MDGQHFDRLARTLHTRRAALGGLLGGDIVAVLGLASKEEAGADNPTAACKKLTNPAKRTRRRHRAKAHRNRCHAVPAAATCAGRRGTYANNCGKAVGCPVCASPKLCLGNGSCARSCEIDACPNGCSCAITFDGSEHYCIPSGMSCPNYLQFQVCATTVDCPLGQACQTVSCGTPPNHMIKSCAPLCQI